MDPKTPKVRIGLITKPHGIKGALKVLPLTPDPHRFEGLEEVWLEKNGRESLAHVEGVQVRKDHVLLQLHGLKNPEDANFWRQAYICVDPQDRIPLGDDAYFVDDLIGLAAYENDQLVGKVTEVLQPGANDVYVIARDGKPPIYFPALKATVLSVDLAQGRMDIRIPVGLLEEDDQ